LFKFFSTVFNGQHELPVIPLKLCPPLLDNVHLNFCTYYKFTLSEKAMGSGERSRQKKRGKKHTPFGYWLPERPFTLGCMMIKSGGIRMRSWKTVRNW
jgi:hypothetical protein